MGMTPVQLIKYKYLYFFLKIPPKPTYKKVNLLDFSNKLVFFAKHPVTDSKDKYSWPLSCITEHHMQFKAWNSSF